jgi:hypothetical protein
MDSNLFRSNYDGSPRDHLVLKYQDLSYNTEVLF